MPPESLSTLAVMKPGPRTARNNMIRIRQRFHIVTLPDSGHADSLPILPEHITRDAPQTHQKHLRRIDEKWTSEEPTCPPLTSLFSDLSGRFFPKTKPVG